MTKIDEHFFDRADAHIRLANEHARLTERGKASASLLYATARFNVHVAACSCDSLLSFSENTNAVRNYYVAQYAKMLDEHLADYAQNFDRYMDASAD